MNDDTLVFFTRSAFSPQCWNEAFPAAQIVRDHPATTISAGLLWVHLPAGAEVDAYLRDVAQRFTCRRFIALSNEPNDDEGIAAFSAGASGYCNAHAAPEVLHQVANVVSNGGLWVGRSLLDRFVFAIADRQQPSDKVEPILEQANLTEREREVALKVAHGVANKEVAIALDISERTVKAHLTSAFKKLGVRDRLQLALLINRGA